MNKIMQRKRNHFCYQLFHKINKTKREIMHFRNALYYTYARRVKEDHSFTCLKMRIVVGGRSKEALFLPFILREVNFSHHRHISGVLFSYTIYFLRPPFSLLQCRLPCHSDNCVQQRRHRIGDAFDYSVLTLVLYKSRHN